LSRVSWEESVPAKNFAVSCKGRKQPVVTTQRIRDPEVATLRTHGRECADLADAAQLGEVLSLFAVARVEKGDANARTSSR